MSKKVITLNEQAKKELTARIPHIRDLTDSARNAVKRVEEAISKGTLEQINFKAHRALSSDIKTSMKGIQIEMSLYNNILNKLN